MMFRTASFAALLLVATSPVAAQANPATASAPVKRGQVLRDANNVRLGAIDSIAADGTLGVIVDTRYIRVPADTVTNSDGKVTTSMVKKDLLARR